MSLTPEDVGQFIQAAHAFERAASRIESIGNTNTTTVTQEPGSALVLACAALVGMNIVLSGVVGFLGMRVFDLDDKLSAIYMMAPHLKQEEKP